jgi:hypothetical protein
MFLLPTVLRNDHLAKAIPINAPPENLREICLYDCFQQTEDHMRTRQQYKETEHGACVRITRNCTNGLPKRRSPGRRRHRGSAHNRHACLFRATQFPQHAACHPPPQTTAGPPRPWPAGPCCRATCVRGSAGPPLRAASRSPSGRLRRRTAAQTPSWGRPATSPARRTARCRRTTARRLLPRRPATPPAQRTARRGYAASAMAAPPPRACRRGRRQGRRERRVAETPAGERRVRSSGVRRSPASLGWCAGGAGIFRRLLPLLRSRVCGGKTEHGMWSPGLNLHLQMSTLCLTGPSPPAIQADVRLRAELNHDWQSLVVLKPSNPSNKPQPLASKKHVKAFPSLIL